MRLEIRVFKAKDGVNWVALLAGSEIGVMRPTKEQAYGDLAKMAQEAYQNPRARKHTHPTVLAAIEGAKR